MKLCGMCKEVKPFSDFRKRTKVKDGHGSWCRKCYAEYDRKRYKENASERERKKRNKQKLIERNKKFIWDFLLKNPCVDCGEKNLIVLEFDHINPHDKEYNVSEMLNLSLIKIKKEIEKCEVRCANCHRIKTYTQFYFDRDKVLWSHGAFGTP